MAEYIVLKIGIFFKSHCSIIVKNFFPKKERDIHPIKVIKIQIIINFKPGISEYGR